MFLLVVFLCCHLTQGLVMPMTNTDGNPDVAKILSHVSALEQSYLTFQSQLQANTVELESTKAQLRVTENKLQTAADQLVVLSAKLDSMGTMSNVTQIVHELQTDVSFEVSLQNPLAGNGILIFDTVSSNQGSSYDHSTGLFHVPVTGTYLFWTNLRIYTSSKHKRIPHPHDEHMHRHYVHLMTDKEMLATGLGIATNENLYTQVSITHVAQLDKGTHVYLSMSIPPPSATIMGSRTSSYGGTLIRRH